MTTREKMRTLNRHTSIQIGDRLRISSNLKDTQVSIYGEVHKRWYTPGRTVIYETREGIELLAAHPDGTMTRGESRVVKITRIGTAPDDVKLF